MSIIFRKRMASRYNSTNSSDPSITGKILDSLTLYPSLSTYEYIPGSIESYPSTYDGVHRIIVNKVTATVDGIETNIRPDMIRNGVTILGIEGSASGGLYQQKYVNPKALEVQNITADKPYDALDLVQINSVQAAAPLFVPEHIEEGINILGLVGTYNGGTPINVLPDGSRLMKSKGVNPSSEILYVHPDDGYVGMEEVVVNSVLNADPNFRPGNIRLGVTIYGITGELDPYEALLQSKEANPSTIVQNITADTGYDGLKNVVINSVLNVAPELKPENIKAGVEIFGIIGNYDGGDTPFVPPANSVQPSKAFQPDLHTYTGHADSPMGSVRDIIINGVYESDPNFRPGNIRKGVTILGLEGTLDYYSGLYQHKSVNPTNEIQTITADTGWDALGTVTVNSVSASEPNLKSENIKKGETIFGIEGEYVGDGDTINIIEVDGTELQKNKVINPSNEIQVVYPDLKPGSTNRFAGFENIIVNSVTDAEPYLKPENIIEGVTIFGIPGEAKTGDYRYQTKSVNPRATTQVITADMGWDALDVVVVNGLTDADPDFIPENIKAGVNILGIIGTYTGGDEPYTPTYNSIQQNKTVNPEIYTQFVYPDEPYGSLARVTVNSVLVSEPDLKPENIKVGVEIFGITGEADISTDTHGPISVETRKDTYSITPTGVDAYDLIHVIGASVLYSDQLKPENIRAGVEIFGVTGNLVVEGEEPPYDPTGRIQPIKSVSPRLNRFTVLPDEPYGSLEGVTINGVGDIEPNLVEGNIKKGVTILGITGTADIGSGVYQRKSVVPEAKAISVHPDTGYDAMNEVLVAGIMDIAPNLRPENIKYGVDILGVIGNFNGGDEPYVPPEGASQPNKVVDPELEDRTWNPDSPYSAMTTVTVRGLKNIEPQLRPENIVQGHSILGVEGIAEAGVHNPRYQTRSVNPNNSIQNITAQYPYDALEKVVVNSVSNADGNLIPENIRAGVTIFDVTGSYTGDGQPPYTPTGKDLEISKAGYYEYDRDVTVDPTTGFVGMQHVTLSSIIKMEPLLTPDVVVEGTTLFNGKLIGRAKAGGGGNYQDEKTVSPTPEGLVVTPDGSYDAVKKVNIRSIANLTADNIKYNVTILGVTGTFNGGYVPPTAGDRPLEHNRIVDPEAFERTYEPTGNNAGFDMFTVRSVTDADPALRPENIRRGVTIFNIEGDYIGQNPRYEENKIVEPKMHNYALEPAANYDAILSGTVVGLYELSGGLLNAQNIRYGVNLFGILGTYDGSNAPHVATGDELHPDWLVQPSNQVQHLEPQPGYKGFSTFTVNSVQNADPNLRPENIKDGVTIFDITGTMPTGNGDRDLLLQIKSTNPTMEIQQIQADPTYDALSTVMVNSIQGAYPAFIASNIKSGVNIAGLVGTYEGDGTIYETIEGRLEDVKSVNPSNEIQHIIPDTYIEDGVEKQYIGIREVLVNSVSNADPNLRPGNIRKGVTIFGVAGILDPGDPGLFHSISVNASNEVQHIFPDPNYDAISDVWVNSAQNTDPNLIPENIKAGVVIFGVEGNYDGGDIPFVPDGKTLMTPEVRLEGGSEDNYDPIHYSWPSGYGGFNEFDVPTVWAYDTNFRPWNIKKGISILGVAGTYDGSTGYDGLHLQQKSVRPLADERVTVHADEGYDALSQVTVESIFESEPALVPENIRKDVNILGIIGTYEGEGSHTYSGNRNLFIDEETDTAQVTIGDLLATDTAFVPENIKSGVTIFGVTGSYVGDMMATVTGTSNKVAIDPSMIRKGYTILGIEGTYEG